jgi:probable rRNA maturation factor
MLRLPEQVFGLLLLVFTLLKSNVTMAFGTSSIATRALLSQQRRMVSLTVLNPFSNSLSQQQQTFKQTGPCRRWLSGYHASSSNSIDGGKEDETTSSVGGEIMIYNEQDCLDISLQDLERTIRKIRSELGYPEYSVTLILTTDDEMQEMNKDQRNVDAPTDILSWPFHSHKIPGTIVEPTLPIPDLYTLGDMMVDVPYVMRRCQEDMAELQPEEERERGVSGAMATIEDPLLRIHMLLIHGMLHLVGYDHIEDGDFELMVTREEELLEKLQLETTATKK